MTDSTPAWDFSKARRNQKYKQKDGVATGVSSRVAKSGNHAHSCTVGGEKFTLFSNEEFCPFSDGDRIAFDYEVKKLRTGSRMPYNSIVPDSLRLTVPADLSERVSGHVYILSNKSMAGLLKIGFTNGDPAKRAVELSGVTGVPTPFRVEWSMPVLGSARAIEQRIHAVLSKQKHGKEFFRVTIGEAQSIARRCYVELYPEAAKELEGSLTAAELAAAERRKQIAEEHARRDQAKRDEAERIAFENSPAQIWKRHGSYEVRLREFSVARRPGRPGLFSKLLGHHFPDWVQIKIYGGKPSGDLPWKLDIHGLVAGRHVGRERASFQRLEDALETAKREADNFCRRNQEWVVRFSNELVAEPVSYSAHVDRYATMTLSVWPQVELLPEYGAIPPRT
ncbi:GIY-YIG nuclease family protein [Rhizobium leguminosarum]|uniref:GIY-YIG nuclease family protein n=1 Tax=Rhizobium leguminosarum TaxID=384 RepID=UPI001C9553F9|nr:GIY-YIG nuclease family protein [Rhizobium leguminosarum]MBY5775969.1 GIY-YIG nuclease family protein [Rhizobium leguminosarum]